MSLLTREKRFDAMSQRFQCERPARLMLISQIDPKLFHTFQVAAMLYFSHSLLSRETILGEENLLAALMGDIGTIRNMTPNGAFMPKMELIPEFNFLHRTYAEIIRSLNIGDLIDQV